MASRWLRRRATLLLPFALVLTAACGDSDAAPREGPPGRGRGPGGPGAGAERAVPVAVRVVQPAELQVAVRGTANLRASEQVEILPKQSGVISRLLVEEGQPVRAGAPLAVLDDEEWRLQARQAEARAQAARDAAERAVALQQQGLLAEQEAVRLRSEAESAAADRDLARLRVANATIRSPISGTVTHRWVERGQLVNTATRAFGVANVDRLEALVGVPEQDALRIRPGQPARILVEGLGQPVPGRVARVRPVVDAASGTVQITVEVDPRADVALRPGQFVTVEIVTETLPDRIVLPRTAVRVDAAKPRVFVLEGGTAAEREVALGANQADRVEILQGLSPGDSVVVVGQDALRAGDPVRLVEVNGQALPASSPPATATGAPRGGGIEAHLRERGVSVEEARAYAERFRGGERQEVLRELREKGLLTDEELQRFRQRGPSGEPRS